MATVDGTIPEKGLAKGTNWWGAFVIGLAGTILVTGIAPYVVQGTGALGIILMGVMTIAGCFLCFCLADPFVRFAYVRASLPFQHYLTLLGLELEIDRPEGTPGSLIP